jgi:hypothetical protein
VAFNSSVGFQYAKFNSGIDFYLTTFGSGISFYCAEFNSKADFEWATFDSGVTFDFAKFDSTVDFWATDFKGTASFREAQFGGDVTFGHAILPDYLDFRYVNDIRRVIDFTLSHLPVSRTKCHIALEGADINKIKLNMTLFTLWFPEDTVIVRPTHLGIIVSRGRISYDGQLSIYESVLKKLKDDGLMESYQILDIEYRQFKFHHGPKLLGILNIGPLLNILNNVWWYYGYYKWLVFIWTIGLWVFFSLVNLVMYPKPSESVYAIAFLEKLETNSLTGVKKLLFDFFRVVTYTAIVFFGLKMDLTYFRGDKVKDRPGLFVYLMFVYVIGLVCLGFIVNIIFTR